MLMRILKFAALSIAAASAHAGTVMETLGRDLNDASKDNAATITTSAQDGRMRVEQGGESVLIFKDDSIYHVDMSSKSYMVMDRKSMKQMADQINPALKQLQEQLATLPPEQRAQMEKMLGDRLGGASAEAPQEFRKTRRTGSAAGHACTYVEIHQGGALSDELCVAAPGALQGSEELMTAARKANALLQEMVKNLDAPWLRQMADRQADYQRIGGVPVVTRHFSDGAAVYETTLKSIRTASLPASLFEPPAGFTEKNMIP